MAASKDLEFKDRVIDLFGSKWKIKFVDDIQVPDNADVDGLTDSTNRLISIKTQQAKQEQGITLLHELIHSMLNTGQYLNASRDEPMVEWLARCFHVLIKQGVLKWNL